MRGTNNLSQNILRESIKRIPSGHPVLLLSDDGQKGHVALRMLKGLGLDQVFNLSGGYTSLERHARAIGFEHLDVDLFPVVRKSVEDLEQGTSETEAEVEETETIAEDGPVILDVRTPMEFAMGAYPHAINIGLDSLPQWAKSFEDKNRKIILYCASGARSSYGVRILKQLGFTQVENGGGLHDMMSRR
jgi:rhodanese-related sulfurtransferase